MKWLDELLQKKPDLDWVKIILKHVATPDRLSALKAMPGNPMERAYYASEDLLVTKWHHYLAIYDRHLSRYRGQPVRLLEIGIGHGGSLQLWRDYFGPQAVIHALDIRPVCAELANDGFDVHIGNQTDRGLLNRIVAEMKGVDVVIDDGSH